MANASFLDDTLGGEANEGRMSLVWIPPLLRDLTGEGGGTLIEALREETHRAAMQA